MATTVTLGLLLGLPAAFVVARAGAAYLVGVSPTAPHLFASAGGVLVVTAFIASLLPAAWAGRIDPMAVLKE